MTSLEFFESTRFPVLIANCALGAYFGYNGYDLFQTLPYFFVLPLLQLFIAVTFFKQ